MKSLIREERGINILSLDAGSLAGVLSQLHVLADFMDRMATVEGIEGELLPSDHFDLIGASGIAALAGLCIGSLKMSVRETIESLQILGLSVFYEHYERSRDTIFDSMELRETLRNLIEGTGHSPDAMIGTANPTSHSKVVFFVSPIVDITTCHRLRTYRGRKGMLQCTILEVAIASMSTVGLFDYAEVGSNRRKYTSVGMLHTNPIKDVLDEAEQVFGKERCVACLMSLGSGSGSDVNLPSNLAHLEVHGLLQAMDMQQQIVTEEVGRRFSNLEAYYRFSVEGIGSGSLSDWIQWDADQVENHSRKYLANGKHSMMLDAAVGRATDGHGTVTLNSLNHASDATIIAKKVPPITPFFVLRQKAWAFIEKNLASAPMDKHLVFLLTGLGGCGKSTLFSYYVQVYGYKYSHIFIIDASSVFSIKTDLQNAVRSLGPEHAHKTWEQALQYFEKDGPNKNWLIGFDSADDPTIPLREFIPKSDHGTTFITSRNRDMFLLTTAELQWELGPMTTEEAVDALLRSAQRAASPSETDLEDGVTLVERLGGLPLAVVQAGAYCFQKTRVVHGNEVRFTFRQYLEEMDQSHGDLMKYAATSSLNGYDKSVHQSLNMSYSALPELTCEFLHLCGHFHHSRIPLLMLESAVDGHFRLAQVITGSSDEQPVIEKKLADLLEVPGKSTTIHLHKIVFSLKMFSLVVTSMTPNSVMLNYHALVSAWSRDILPPTEQQLHFEMATRVISTCSANQKYYLVHSSLLPHIKIILKRPENIHLNDMSSFGAIIHSGGMASEAEALFRLMYEQCVSMFGEEDQKSLRMLWNLSLCIGSQGRHEEAAELEQKVLDGNLNVYSEDDETVLMIENNLANTYTRQGRWSEAEEILSRILAVQRSRAGSQDPRALDMMANLAVVYHRQGRYQEAMEMQEELVEQCSQVFGKDHPHRLLSMNNLAYSYQQLGRYDDAQRMGEEALEIMKNTNGADHPHTLNAMHNLTATYSLQRKLEDALTIGQQALDGMKRVLGKKRPETLNIMYLVALICFKMQRISEGIQLQEELRELEGEGGQWTTALLRVCSRTQ